MEELFISGYCKIREKKITVNDEVVFHDENAPDFSSFIKSAYKHINLSYPKFFKMDNLSKLGFLAADLLLKRCNASNPQRPDETSIIITNSSSSLDTDFNYFDSIKDKENYFPSPAVFVYTLPNIMMGEICIKNKITGENTFFVSEKFDTDFICRYVRELFSAGKHQKCLMGWVELMGDRYEAVLYFIEKCDDPKPENVNFDTENTLRIYRQ